MGDLFGSVVWLIISLGVLVTFHEFGHFWVARRFGVRVLRFSVGFGKPLWKRRGRDGVEYVIAAIPLGGYVKMLDEREVEVAPQDRHQAFNTKPVGQRFAIVAAGPVFNLLLTLLLLWGMFIVGKADFAPLVGRATGIAAEAGLRTDDRILAIDGTEVDTWTHAGMQLTTAALDRRSVRLEVSDAGHATRQLTLDTGKLGEHVDETAVIRDLGLVPRQILLDPVVGRAVEGGAAAAAGLRSGDRILAIDGQPIDFWDAIGRAMQARTDGSAPVLVRIARGADRLELEITPTWLEADGRGYWALGIESPRTPARYDALLQYGPVAAIGASLRETWRLTETTVGMLGRMVTGVASLQNISGPITIAQYANTSAQLGLAWFLFFLAVLSLSLCIMNLLPIPILDGGHLLYYLIEMIKGSPVSERTMAAGQLVGLAMLAGLMGLAFYNDILRLVN
ncbi:MAG: RIP metalloprotease RseP [Lysobacteraceae bacterium]